MKQCEARDPNPNRGLVAGTTIWEYDFTLYRNDRCQRRTVFGWHIGPHRFMPWRRV